LAFLSKNVKKSNKLKGIFIFLKLKKPNREGFDNYKEFFLQRRKRK